VTEERQSQSTSSSDFSGLGRAYPEGRRVLKICRMCQEYVLTRKMSHSFTQNCCWITLQVSHHQPVCVCVCVCVCQKWKVKLIFRGAFRLSGTGIVECLELVDVGCNLKQFDGLTLITLTPTPADFTTDLHHWALETDVS